MSMSATACPFCDRSNPDSAKYCNECGSPLYLKQCARCEAMNGEVETHCYRCGGALSEESIEPDGTKLQEGNASSAPAEADPQPGMLPANEAVSDGEPSHETRFFIGPAVCIEEPRPTPPTVPKQERSAIRRIALTGLISLLAAVTLALGGGYAYRHAAGVDEWLATRGIG